MADPNKKVLRILTRGLIALTLGVVAGVWLNVDSIAWVAICGVPVLLTAINLGSRGSTQVESSQQTETKGVE